VTRAFRSYKRRTQTHTCARVRRTHLKRVTELSAHVVLKSQDRRRSLRIFTANRRSRDRVVVVSTCGQRDVSLPPSNAMRGPSESLRACTTRVRYRLVVGRSTTRRRLHASRTLAVRTCMRTRTCNALSRLRARRPRGRSVQLRVARRRPHNDVPRKNDYTGLSGRENERIIRTRACIVKRVDGDVGSRHPV